LPPGDEAYQIATFLDRETAKIDTLIAKQERLIALLQEKRQALISHVVTKGLNPDAPMKDSGVEWLGQVPEHWSVVRLRFLIQVNPAKSEVSGLDRTTLVSFLPMEAISTDGQLDLRQRRSIGDVYHGFTYFRDGDVIVAKITPCFENGKGALARELENGLAFGTTELHVLRGNVGVCPDYIWWVTKARRFLVLGELEMRGAAGQQRVPEDFVKDFFQPIPPTSAEQIAIADFLESATAKIDLLITKQQGMTASLQERRTALISAAVTGKIDVRGYAQ